MSCAALRPLRGLEPQPEKTCVCSNRGHSHAKLFQFPCPTALPPVCQSRASSACRDDARGQRAANERLSPPTTTARTTSPNCVVTMTPRTISPPSSPPKRLQYSRPSLLRENSCSQTLFADSSDFMAAEPATPAKEKTEPAPVAPKKSVRFAEGTVGRHAAGAPLTIDNLEEGLPGTPRRRRRPHIDSPEPESAHARAADEAGEFGCYVLLSAEDASSSRRSEDPPRCAGAHPRRCRACKRLSFTLPSLDAVCLGLLVSGAPLATHRRPRAYRRLFQRLKPVKPRAL